MLDELDEVRRRLVRNRKVREENNRKADEKYECMMREMANAGQPVQLADFSALDFGITTAGGASPFSFGVGPTEREDPSVGEPQVASSS